MFLKAVNGINILNSTNEEIDVIINQLTDGKAINIDLTRGEECLNNFRDKVSDFFCFDLKRTKEGSLKERSSRSYIF